MLVLRDVARFVLFGIVLFCQDRLDSGIPTGLLSLLLVSVLMTLLSGPTLLGYLSWYFAWACWGVDLGVGGVSYVELLILNELWAGERLSLEKAHPRYLRPGRQISVSAVPFWSRHRYLALLSFHWCFNEVSFLAAWWTC